MVPVDEARQTLEFDDHFVIQPVRRSWTRQVPAYVAQGRPCPEGFSYSSDSNEHWLSNADLVRMIEVTCPIDSGAASRPQLNAA